MTNGNTSPSLQVLGVLAIKRGLDLVTELDKSGKLEPWQLDLWQHLIYEFFLSYNALAAWCQEGNIAGSAWMTRNILELVVWVAFCARSRDDAKRFYDDKARDTFEFLDAIEGLTKLLDERDTNVSSLLDETRKRIAVRAEAEGYENIDETYQRVKEAAQQVGLGPFFLSMNKLLSKFAHPTAMMVFSFPDEPSRTQFCVFFIAAATVLCTAAMAEFEQYTRK